MNKLIIISALALVALTGCAQDSAAPTGANTSADVPDSAALLAAGDPVKGQRQFIFCQACHTAEAGGGNKVGPNLFGILDRNSAQADGFVYSQALSEAGLVWDEATLDQWVENPSALVPGTTMVFVGINDPEQRADLIAYLKEATGSAN